MLNKTFAFRGECLKNLNPGVDTLMSASRLRYLTARYVATTSTSKTQQAAAQRCATDHQVDPRRHLEQEAELAASKHRLEMALDEKYQSRLKHLDIWQSVDTIKRLGHRLAKLDPLDLKQPESLKGLTWVYPLVERLKYNHETIATDAFLNTKQPIMSVNEIISAVENIYTGNECGLEFSHMSNQTEVEWLTSQWEKLNETFHLSEAEENNLARLLLECEAFDHFMASKFPTTKRYGCEGAESMLVVFDEILRLCHLFEGHNDELLRSMGQIDDVIIGMPHRGRLNLLACLLGFEPAAIFSKARGDLELNSREAWMAKGDVLSHLSTNVRFVYGLNDHQIGLSRETPEPINVSLLPNPSHLEISAPMVNGTARGRAHNIHYGYSSSPKFGPPQAENDHPEGKKNPTEHIRNQHYSQHLSKILPVQVHGDASVAGQGIIQETLQMSNLPKFTVGGSLHLVVNNQIGYTTDSSMGRSSRYCTDVFKLIEAPIIHVNAQNIPSIVRATRLALAYRQEFGKDVAIDLISFRRHGHNEMDEPSFTQPVMYDTIRRRKSIPQAYCDNIKLNSERRKQIVDGFKEKLQDSFKGLERFKPDNENYRNFNLPTEFHRDNIFRWRTGCDLNLLKSVALASVQIPSDFNVHPNLKRVLIDDRKQRFAATDNDQLAQVKVDWATSEILAIGSLMKQNHTVRLAGQDVARGTFSTRHAVLYDQLTGEPFEPLNEMVNVESQDKSDQSTVSLIPPAKLEIANTILSEEAALAYEFGYSAETCELSIWEAQFGDFFNTAQSIIDTLISSSESKWLKQSALTLLLPHGLDGAGPEHSSSHIERFLQLSSSRIDSVDTEAKVNWSICFPTLPAQYFHLLRRQILRPMRKPLIVMSPKVIFRHPECISSLREFNSSASFASVLDDPRVVNGAISREKVNTIVFCSGKVYFLLDELRQKGGMNNLALVRLEELCPFPIASIVEIIRNYPQVDRNRYYWFQEEHKNQGAFSFVDSRFKSLADLNLIYLGRNESELPATGSSILHKKELEVLCKQFQSLSRS